MWISKKNRFSITSVGFTWTREHWRESTVLCYLCDRLCRFLSSCQPVTHFTAMSQRGWVLAPHRYLTASIFIICKPAAAAQGLRQLSSAVAARYLSVRLAVLCLACCMRTCKYCSVRVTDSVHLWSAGRWVTSSDGYRNSNTEWTLTLKAWLLTFSLSVMP